MVLESRSLMNVYTLEQSKIIFKEVLFVVLQLKSSLPQHFLLFAYARSFILVFNLNKNKYPGNILKEESVNVSEQCFQMMFKFSG